MCGFNKHALILFLPWVIICQSHPRDKRYYAVEMGGGISWYGGDLNPYAIPFPQIISPAFYMSLKRIINPRYTFLLRGRLTWLKGTDELQFFKFYRSREFYFRAFVIDGSIGIEFNFFYFNPLSPKKTWTPYLGAEIGVAGIKHLETYINPPRAVTTAIFTLSPGIKTILRKNVLLNVSMSFIKTFSDYVDNVPVDTYRDVASPCQTISDEGCLITLRRGVGTNTNPDWYFTITGGISFLLGKELYQCPTPGK